MDSPLHNPKPRSVPAQPRRRAERCRRSGAGRAGPSRSGGTGARWRPPSGCCTWVSGRAGGPPRGRGRRRCSVTAGRPAGGLAEEVDEKVLHAAFIPFGDITDIQIPLDYETGACLEELEHPWHSGLGGGGFPGMGSDVSVLPLTFLFPPSRKAPGIRLRGV